MVTAETAVVLPVLVVVLAGAVSVIAVVGAQLRCVDAAREGARAAARGEETAVVLAVAGQVAPDGAVVSSVTRGEEVTVTVQAAVRPLGIAALAVAVGSTATARTEPGTAGTPP